MDKIKNPVVLYSSKNTKGRRDATGAFIPEAKSFARLHGVPGRNCVAIPCVGVPKWTRRAHTLRAIRDAADIAVEPIDLVAFFGHGWHRGIQFGFKKKQIPDLVKALAPIATRDLRVVLYACLTAENSVKDWITNPRKLGPATEGGFADRLRDGLAGAGLTECRVDAHKTAGHTTFNPYLVRFLGVRASEPGGFWLVQPRSELWDEWRGGLHGDLRFRFPLMSQAEIVAELNGGTGNVCPTCGRPV